MRTPRRRSREFVLQALYQLILNPEYSAQELSKNIKETETFLNASQEKKPKVDENFFDTLFLGIYPMIETYQIELTPYLDRSWEEVNAIEKAILLIACHELKTSPETPFPVIINESVELAKGYAKEDSYKFINGVLDRLSIALRPYDNP
ncbi:transcription antitermination factor NusB [Neisseriaceae bacterium PsAf]|nr:transcription antitermination factor NusB [Neisseriaceae bacterium PsAf]MCV2504005.1 transcription antitermination factor NusB [Neisseriaceae bacterium]